MTIDLTDASWESWAESFTIFAKCEPQQFAEVYAEHDIFYATVNPAKVSDEDKSRLEQLGWHIDPDELNFYHFV